MTARIIGLSSLFLISLLSFGCGGAANTNTTVNNAANNANTAKPKDEITNAAPTLTPVFKAYCDAWAKKDEAALRKVYSADTLKYFEEDMKDQKIKSLMKYLEDDAVSGNICEARNEVINGDEGLAEIRADKFPNGIKVEFVKENGEWKMTNKSPEVQPKSATQDPVAPSTGANRAAEPAAKKDDK
jgi:hypothetical protein